MSWVNHFKQVARNAKLDTRDPRPRQCKRCGGKHAGRCELVEVRPGVFRRASISQEQA